MSKNIDAIFHSLAQASFTLKKSGYIGQVVISMLRVLLFVARPRTHVLGNIPNLASFRNVTQYPGAIHIPGILILQIAAPIYFANASYLRERLVHVEGHSFFMRNLTYIFS